MNLESTFRFGKYKGRQVEDVVEDDPGYIRWLCENTETEFDDAVLEALEKRESRR
jgi:uncharacterized protein (DUF3820 family)